MANDKKSSFVSIREKIVNRMFAWMLKSFSAGAKKTLTKLVIQVVLTYLMSLFSLSLGICLNIRRLVPILVGIFQNPKNRGKIPIGLIGKSFVSLRIKEACVFVTLRGLTRLFSLSKIGG